MWLRRSGSSAGMLRLISCCLATAAGMQLSLSEPLLALHTAQHFSALTVILDRSDWSWRQGLHLRQLYREASWSLVYTSTLYLDQLSSGYHENMSTHPVRPLYVLTHPAKEELQTLLRRPEAGGVLVCGVTPQDDPQALLEGVSVPTSLQLFWLGGSGDAQRMWQVHQPLPHSPPTTAMVARREAGRWFFLGRPGNRWSGRLNLQGATISSTATGMDEKTIEDLKKEFPNNQVQYFTWNILMQYLNFKTLLVADTGGVGQRLAAGNWSGIIGMLQRGAVDTCMTPMMPTAERAVVSSTARHGIIVENRIFIKRPEFQYSWDSSLSIFSLGVWLTFLATAAVLAVALWAVAGAGRRAGVERGRGWSFSSCCVLVAGYICAQGSDSTPHSLAGRTVCLVCLVFSYCISQFYCSVLVSQLTARTSVLPFEDVEQFVARRTHDMAMFPQLAPTRFAQTATSGVMKRLWDEFIQNRPGSIVQGNPMDVLPRLCEGHTAMFAPTVYVLALGFLREAPCELVYLKPIYFKASSGIVTRKDFPFLPQFNHLLQRMMEAGLLNYINTKFFGTVVSSAEPSPLEAISLNPVSPFFFLLGCGALLGSAILLAELGLHRYRVAHGDAHSRGDRFEKLV